jgi:hypothetical protein
MPAITRSPTASADAWRGRIQIVMARMKAVMDNWRLANPAIRQFIRPCEEPTIEVFMIRGGKASGGEILKGL